MNPQDIDIRTLLPQQEPVVMVDRLISADLTTATTELDIRDGDLFVENGALKSYALIENFAQTCAAQLGYVDKYVHGNDCVRIGYIGSVKKMHIFDAPRVGETMVTCMRVQEDFMNMKLVTVESFVENRQIATSELTIAISEENVTV